MKKRLSAAVAALALGGIAHAEDGDITSIDNNGVVTLDNGGYQTDGELAIGALTIM